MTSTPSAPGRSSRPRLEGRTLGRYRVLGHVASGGMASVFVARAAATYGFERLVALKVLHPHLAEQPEFVAMFVDEARLAARIRHPKVVGVLDVADDEAEGLYLVMEYVEGDHLGTLVEAARARGEHLPARVVLRVALDLLEGLGAAHELRNQRGEPTPIVHRDCSPHNVLVGVDGIARLSDFGVARAEARLTQTEAGKFKGKLGYMAPEQLTTGGGDTRSDLFAAGVVIFEALTGQRLFRGEGTGQTLRLLLHEPIPDLASLRPELAPLGPVLDKALRRDPEERFASAAAMAEALYAVTDRVGGAATPREVGEVVRSLRAEVLARRRERILDARDEDESSVEVARRDLALSGRTNSGLTPATGTSSLGQSLTPPPASKRRWALAGMLVLGALGGVFAAWWAAPLGESAPGAALTLGPDASPVLGALERGPELLEGVAPVLPAGDQSVAPTITLRLLVGSDGRVRELRTLQPRPGYAEIERVAEASARGYRFSPARAGGVPVEAWLNLPVRFEREPAEGNHLRIEGSDTIGAVLAPALALAFRALRPDVRVDVRALGSSTAFLALMDGTAELGASSRDVSSAEADRAAELGVPLHETVIAYDGVAVIVHPSNPLRHISMTELARVFSGDVRHFAALGHPDAGLIELVGRPSYSGTHGFFEEHALAPQTRGFAPEIREIERSEELVRYVAEHPGAIAYVGAVYVTPAVRALPIAATRGAEAVAVDEQSIREGSYPIARALRFYTAGHPRGATAELLRFVLSDEGHEIISRHGFVPSDATLPLDPADEGAHERAQPTIVERVGFSYGATTVDAAARPTIRRIVARLREAPATRAQISGSADAEGSEPDNERLGLHRAEAVAHALTRAGIVRERLEVETLGSTAPIASNRSEEGRAKNRRVDVRLVRVATTRRLPSVPRMRVAPADY